MTTYLNALGVVCSLGVGKQAVAEAMFNMRMARFSRPLTDVM